MSAPGIAATREERIPYLVQRAENRDRPHEQRSASEPAESSNCGKGASVASWAKSRD
jgi:hypothetical protein